jgi:hypothetical protein
MNHIIHAAYTCLHTHGGETTSLTNNRARGRRWDNFIGNKNLGQITAPINFIVSIISKKHKTRVILSLEMAQTFSISKPKLNEFLMLVVSTLHQAWSSYSLSMQYIYLKTLVGLQVGAQITHHCHTSWGESWLLQFSLLHNVNTSTHYKYVKFGTLPSTSPQHCAW